MQRSNALTDFDVMMAQKCAESRKDVPFGVKIFNVVFNVFNIGRQTTIKIIEIKQQFLLLAFCNNV